MLRDHPSNSGKKWSVEEENLLLDELDNKLEIKTIAEKHNRTVNGIKKMQKKIAYKMYLNNVCIEEIVSKTKLTNKIIKGIIAKDISKIEKSKNTTCNDYMNTV